MADHRPPNQRLRDFPTLKDTTPDKTGLSAAAIAAFKLTLTYDRVPILSNLNVSIPKKAFTAIVGPNGCGKSTLLFALGRILRPQTGVILLSGQNIQAMPTFEVAKNLGLLPQSSMAPEDITVKDLVLRGRYPYRRPLRALSSADHNAVQAALEETGLTELADRQVDTLSGGQKQRAWIAMVLAQDPEVLLLDEPTSYLDLAHQVELLRLLRRLCDQSNKTIAVIMHDLNQAVQYADHLIVMKSGRICEAGGPAEVITAELVHEVFDVECSILPDPRNGKPMVLTAV